MRAWAIQSISARGIWQFPWERHIEARKEETENVEICYNHCRMFIVRRRFRKTKSGLTADIKHG